METPLSLETFLDRIRSGNPVSFEETLAVIEQHYEFTPTAFRNGTLSNSAEENQGSCRVFAFAQQHQLNREETLACFGQHYRDVLSTPTGESHQNIRNFMKTGWAGIELQGSPLRAKA